MFRRPGAGRSRATADTLCQKCLKRGHYSYECKATAQERPYTSRPSRTQQLLNPKLKPKLTTEISNDLLRKDGVADEILKLKEEDRKRSRSRARSTSSIDSVSTISTNRSRSRSPFKNEKDIGVAAKTRNSKALGKRPRRSVSMESRSSLGSQSREKNTRRRMSAFSPDERGRRRSRSKSKLKARSRSRSRLGSARMHTSPNNGDNQPRNRNGDWQHGRHTGRVSSRHSRSRSHDRMDIFRSCDTHDNASRGRWRNSPSSHHAQSRSPSPYRGDQKRSPSPTSHRQAARLPTKPSRYRERMGSHDGPPSDRNHFDDRPNHPNGKLQPSPQAPASRAQKERSLSPYSKRVALTRTMKSG